MIAPAHLRHEVLDRIGAGVVIVDPRTRLIEWANPTAAALFGAPVDAILGQRCHCFLCPAEEGNCPVLDQGNEVDNAERVLLRHDGSQLPVMKSVKRISIDGQEKLLETFIDISERKRAEAVRREGENRYRVLFENSRDAMMVLAPPAWNYVAANAATLELFGVKDEATFLSLTPWDVSPATQPDGRPSAEKALELIKIAMLEGAHAFEWRHQRLDGREISTSVQLTRLEFAGQSLLQATERDLGPTERALSALRDSEARLRLAVEALQESQEQLDKVFNSSANAMSLNDPVTGKILDVNETWVRASGISRRDAIGKVAMELEPWVRWNDYAVCRQALEREGQLREFETKLVLQGQERQFVLNAEFLGLRRGRFLLLEFRDITERKQAETALRESEEQLERIFNNSTNGLAFTEFAGGKILKVNDTWVRMTGISRSDAIGKSTSELNMWAYKHEREACLATLGSEGCVRDFEATLVVRGGQRHLVLNADFMDLHSRRYLMWELRDITERKQAQEEIALLKHSIDVHYDAAYWTDTEGKLIYVNEAACKALGYERGDLIGKTIADVNEEATAERMQMVWAALRAEGFHRRESMHRRKDGSEFPVEILTTYVRFGGKEYSCAFARDISERELAKAEKAKLAGQLQQALKMESVGRLAGGVAHDFNNMLGVILGHAELALERVDPVGPLHNDLVNIQSAAKRSADLTRQLLAFARKQTVAPKVLNLNDTVTGMLKMVRRLIGEDIQLTWRPGENLWPVKIDPTQIDQILANLCVNARDAIADVGKITIETGTKVIDADLAAATLGLFPGNYVWLAISDDGCGMDAATQSHVFEPFFTTKEVGKGTGLGLATVYGIVKQNTGFIDVRSELGRGTVFTIYLPRHVGKEVQARSDAVAGTLKPGQEIVLLVEDEESLLEITQRMLEKRGYKVLTANTPGHAMQLAREYKGRIDLLITDVVMPEMNGRDLAKNFLSLYPEAKRLFMSGYTADVIAHQGVLEPGVFFIQKPFSAQELATIVRKVLEG